MSYVYRKSPPKVKEIKLNERVINGKSYPVVNRLEGKQVYIECCKGKSCEILRKPTGKEAHEEFINRTCQYFAIKAANDYYYEFGKKTIDPYLLRGSYQILGREAQELFNYYMFEEAVKWAMLENFGRDKAQAAEEQTPPGNDYVKYVFMFIALFLAATFLLVMFQGGF